MRQLKNWIDSYVEFTRHDEAPEVFHLWTALTILAATVNRNCWMSRAYYKCYPNIYTLFVGPSGIGKSSSASIGIGLLQETSVCPLIYKDFITTPALLNFMSKGVRSYEIRPGVLVEKTPVLIFASELGNLLNERSGIKELTLLLTELFNKEGDHEDSTISRATIKIIKPNVTALLCCFPQWLEEELPSVSLRSGFMGRMLTTVAHAKRFRNPNPKLSSKDEYLRDCLKNDLEHIATLYGEMQWDNQTKDIWDSWYKDQPLDLKDLDVEIEGFVARKAQYVQRIAMLHCLARTDSKILETQDFLTGLRLVEDCGQSLGTIGRKDKHYGKVEIVLNTLKRHKSVTVLNLMRWLSKKMNKKGLDEALDQLITAGYIKYDKVNKIVHYIGKEEEERNEEARI